MSAWVLFSGGSVVAGAGKGFVGSHLGSCGRRLRLSEFKHGNLGLPILSPGPSLSVGRFFFLLFFSIVIEKENVVRGRKALEEVGNRLFTLHENFHEVGGDLFISLIVEGCRNSFVSDTSGATFVIKDCQLQLLRAGDPGRQMKTYQSDGHIP